MPPNYVEAVLGLISSYLPNVKFLVISYFINIHFCMNTRIWSHVMVSVISLLG